MRVATLLVGLAALPVAAEPTEGQPGPAAKKEEIRTYYVAFIRDNPQFEEEEWIGEAMAEHRVDRTKTASDTYLQGLIIGEVALIAGPLEDAAPLRQAAVLDVESAEQARAVFDHSPAIESGRQQVEVFAWRAPAGILKRAKDPTKLRDVYLGLLKKPAQVPKHTPDQLAELERGHLENLRRMFDTGHLAIAGPIEGGGDLRGLMIFRDQNEARVRDLVAADPAVQARRLQFELLRWKAPQKSWIPLTDEQFEARRAEEAGEE